MKKIIFTAVLLLALILGVVAITSCSGDLAQSPSYIRFDIDTQTLKWNKVPGARTYEIEISGQERVKTTTKNTFSVEFLDAGEYTVRIRSISGNPEIEPSKWISFEFERAEENGLRYKLINNRSEYQITGSGTAMGDVVVPATYRGKPVTSVADKAFYNNKKLTSLTFEGGITSIGKNAFAKCAELTSITLPDSVKDLGEYAFQSCKKLTSITLPDGITELKPHTFAWCELLTTVTIGSGITAIGDYAFSSCESLSSITISDSVKTIGEYAFSECTSLTSIKLGSGMESIGNYAFIKCSAVETIDLGNSIKSIGIGAFTGCALVTEIEFPDSMITIGAEAFVECTELATIKIGSGVQSIGSYAFYGTSAMNDSDDTYLCVDGWLIYCRDKKIEAVAAEKNTELPEGTYGIADNAFYDCDKLDRVFLDGVKYIGAGAFAGCGKLYEVHCDDALLEIRDGAFNSCIILSDIEVGNSLTTIGNNAFQGCRTLYDIDLPQTLTSVGAYSFYGTQAYNVANDVVYIDDWAVGVKEGVYISQINVKEGTRGIANYAFSDESIILYGNGVALPESLRIIGMGAFYNCEQLRGIGWYNKIEYIGDYAFYDCKGLWFTNWGIGYETDPGITRIPDTVKYIGRSAFYTCEMMIGVEIGSMVEYIGPYAFYGCKNLGDSGEIWISIEAMRNGEPPLRGDVIISDGVQFIGDRAFQSCSNVREFIIPDTVTSLGNRVFYKCDNLEKVVIGEGIVNIPDYTFYKCENLIEAVISDSVETIGEYAFRGCISLQELTIGQSVTFIGKGAFFGCESVREIVIPATVKTLGEYAFRGCTGVDSIVLPSTVETIGRHAFYGLKNVTVFTDVKFEEGILPPYWNERWNSSYRPVLWGCTLSEDMTYVVSYTYSVNKLSNPDSLDATFKPEREGYTFMGWATAEGSTEVVYKPDQILTVTEGTVLYAVWQEGEEVEVEENETEDGENTESGEQNS